MLNSVGTLGDAGYLLKTIRYLSLSLSLSFSLSLSPNDSTFQGLYEFSINLWFGKVIFCIPYRGAKEL